MRKEVEIMTCQDYKSLMMGYLDNELDDDQRKAFEEHLKTCKECADELEEFKQLKQITDDVVLLEPEDKIWQQYWSNIYNRTERNIGWILMSISGILLLIYGGFKIIEAIIKDPAVDFILKGALLTFIFALAILFVSVLRERIFFWKKDRYKNIRR